MQKPADSRTMDFDTLMSDLGGGDGRQGGLCHPTSHLQARYIRRLGALVVLVLHLGVILECVARN